MNNHKKCNSFLFFFKKGNSQNNCCFHLYLYKIVLTNFVIVSLKNKNKKSILNKHIMMRCLYTTIKIKFYKIIL